MQSQPPGPPQDVSADARADETEVVVEAVPPPDEGARRSGRRRSRKGGLRVPGDTVPRIEPVDDSAPPEDDGALAGERTVVTSVPEVIATVEAAHGEVEV